MLLIAKFLFNVTNGYKTVSGMVVTAAGFVLLFFVPRAQDVGENLLYVGVPLMAVGLAHKIHKTTKKKER